MTDARSVSNTSLGPGFLKDLGFEKPSWLPDFGGGEKEEESEPAVAAKEARTVAVTEESGKGEEGETKIEATDPEDEAPAK